MSLDDEMRRLRQRQLDDEESQRRAMEAQQRGREMLAAAVAQFVQKMAAAGNPGLDQHPYGPIPDGGRKGLFSRSRRQAPPRPTVTGWIVYCRYEEYGGATSHPVVVTPHGEVFDNGKRVEAHRVGGSFLEGLASELISHGIT